MPLHSRIRSRRLAALLVIVLGTGLQLASTDALLHAATCIGANPCNACRTCSSCRYCAKQGGKCGICRLKALD